MGNKNIIFKHTLNEYNKRYRYHKNLLKFTKKEVEEFDRAANTIGEHKVLDHNKWWFINGTYYQVPKALHHYWFRNLNAGVQTAICLLGAGVIATGASLPFILKLGQTVEPSITISGADFDKTNSHIELHKQSTIKLKEQSGKTIKGIEYVKVGDKTLTANSDYSYDESTKVVTIKAEAMTSTRIEIKVKTEEPAREVTKEQFLNQAEVLYQAFLNSTKVYDATQLSDITINGKTVSGENIEVEYTGTVGTDRKFNIKDNSRAGLDGTFAGYDYSRTTLENYLLSETEDGHFKINSNGSIEYYTNASPASIPYYKILKINQYGYVTCFDFYISSTAVGICKATYTSEPHEPVEETDKEKFVRIANEWISGDNGFKKATSEYTLSQLAMKKNNIDVNLTKIEYSESEDHRGCYVEYDDSGTTSFYCADSDEDGTHIKNWLKDASDTVTYEFKDDYIYYKDTNTSEGETKELKYNKYGYKLVDETDGEDRFEFTYNGIPEIYYNIDWATTKFELVSEESKTLYEYALEATQIEFVESDDTSGVCVGEDSGEGQEPVYASFKTEDEEKTLKVWSAGKIRFEDDDRFGRDLEQEEQGRGFFCSCEDCVSITLDNIDTSKVTDFNGTFFECQGLTSLDVSNFDTFNATDMSTMFEFGRISSTINTISGLENFNTEKVTTMEEMFCETTLKTLNLSSFNTKSLKNTDSMFSVSIDLEKIYVSDKFVVNNVTTSTDMFEDCNELVGGNGTKVSDKKVYDKTYAKIDKVGQEGYFTEIPSYELIYDTEGRSSYDSENNINIKKGLNEFYLTVYDGANYLSTFAIYSNEGDGTRQPFKLLSVLADEEDITSQCEYDEDYNYLTIEQNIATGKMVRILVELDNSINDGYSSLNLGG